MPNPADGRRAGLSPARAALLDRWQRGRSRTTASGIPGRAATGPAVLSFAQERLWLLDRFLGPGNAYNTVPLVARLQGPLNVELLIRSFQEVVRRHDVMRTRFTVTDDGPRQVVEPELEVTVELTDLRACSDPEAEAFRLVGASRQETFDLATGPLFRTRLLRIAEHQHILLHLMHHMISDGWSDDVLIREISTSYLALCAGRPSPLPLLPIQYADYAHWQRDWLAGRTLEDLLGYWRTTLAGAPAVLELPTDGPRPGVQRFAGASHQVRIPQDTTRRLRDLAQAEGATLFMTLLAVVDVFLSRYSGQADIVVGSPVANRTRPELEALIGCFINTVVLRTDLAGDPTFPELLSRVREVALGAYAHQELPFERLVEELQPERDTSRNPLFQVMFVLQNSPPADLEFGDFRLSPVEIDNGVAKFDLTIDLREYDGELVGRIQFDSDLFGPATRERMVSHLLTLVEGVAAQPNRRLSELPLLGEGELDQMLTGWNQTAVEHNLDCVHRLIEAQAAQAPDAVAVSAPDGQLSYRELNRRADRLADSLRLLGVGPDTLVGLCVERSVHLAVGILGILKAGAAYVPLDPTHPVDRLAYILDDARAPVVVTQTGLIARLPASSVRTVCLDTLDLAAPATHRSPVGPTLDNLAYVIYTSGSTGQPKGVMISHRAVSNMILSTRVETGVGPGDTVLQFATVCFDVSVLEIFLALATGAKLVIPDSETVLDPAAVTGLLEREQITVFDIPPAVLELLPPDAVTTRRVQFIGCEAFGGELATRWQASGSRLINGYGPTEATVMMTWTELDQPYTRMPPIGRPMPNHQAYVVDRAGQPVPIGTPGELHIGGVGLARGYLGRPGLTAEKFTPDPFGGVEGQRLYRTGDLARALPDGTLEFMGRVDQQVKIRGYRIELPEIEAVLDRHPDVRHAVVVVRDPALSSRHLVAYVQVSRGNCRAEEIREWLGRRLPGYLVPQVIVPLDRLPLLPSGKVDRSALPDPDTVLTSLAEQAQRPRNDTERILSDTVFAEVLGTDKFGVHDNFFQLGGNSLQLAKLQARIAERLGTMVPLRALFEGPSVAELAEYLDRRSDHSRRPTTDQTAPAPSSDADRIPLTWQQEQLWQWATTPGTAYHKPLAARLKGVVDVDTIRAAVRELARRHEMLHTVFTPVDGGWAQRSDPSLAPEFTVVDLAGQGVEGAMRVASAEVTRAFDVEHGPLARVLLLRLDDFDHVLVATLHPLLWDGWSRGVFARELLILGDVAMSTEPLAPLSTRYADYARWQRDWLAGPEPVDLARYWQDVMTSPPAPLRLPGHAATGSPTSGARYPVPLPCDLSDAVLTLTRTQGVTLFTVLMTGFSIALHLLTGESDIVVGVPMANRVRPGTAELIGRFVNTLPIRTRLQGAPTVGDLMAQVGGAVAGARDHQEVPPHLITTGAPELTITFDLLEAAADLPPAVGLEILPVQVATGRTDFELTMAVERRPGGLDASITYATAVYPPRVVAELAECYLAVLRAMTDDPGRALGTLTWGRR